MSAEASAVAARREDNDRRHGGEQSELRKLAAFVDTELEAQHAERDRAAEALDQASARLKAELETKADVTEAEVAVQRDELAQKEVRAPARARCDASYEYCDRSDSPSLLRRLLLILRPLRLSLATATTPTNTATAPTLPRYYDDSY